MSTIWFAVVAVAVSSVVLQWVLTRLSGTAPHPFASLIVAVYVSSIAVALRLWPRLTLAVFGVCVAVVLWLCRGAVLAGRDIETADRELGEKVGRS